MGKITELPEQHKSECSYCKKEISREFVFCPFCGQELSSESDGNSDVLKIITILFADVKGFTAMSEKLEPDEVKEIISSIFGEFSEIISSENGMVLKYEGDCVMAAFGMDRSTESEPLHAGYASLKMMSAFTDFQRNYMQKRGLTAGLRIGLHAGRVCMGKLGGRMDVLGDSVNMAARMEQNAPEGTVLISKDLARLLRGRFKLENNGPIYVKGKTHPVETFILQDLEELSNRSIFGKVPGITGRDNVLQDIKEHLSDKIESSSNTILHIQGKAGIGKSRLLNTSLEYLGGRSEYFRLFRIYYTSSQAAPFHLFRVLLFKTLSKYSFEELIKLLEKCEPDDGFDNIKLTCSIMSRLFNIPSEEPLNEYTLKSSEYHEIAIKGMQAILSKLLQEKSIVFALENVHWADRESLLFIEKSFNKIKCKHPLVIIITSRPELSDEYSDILSDVQFSRTLEPLSREDGLKLMEKILGCPLPLSERVIEELLNVSKGIPLFIEECLLHLHDCGLLSRNSRDLWEFDISGYEKYKWPISVELLLQSRLEGLEVDELSDIKFMAALGDSFFTLPFSEKICSNFRSNLKKYFERSILSSETTFSSISRWPDIHALNQEKNYNPDDIDNAAFPVYQFSHQLLQQVAYNMMTGKQKVSVHAEISASVESWLKTNSSGLTINFCQFLSNQFEKAEMPHKQAFYLLQAGKLLRESYYAERALEVFEKLYAIVLGKPYLLTEENAFDFFDQYRLTLIYLGEMNKAFKLMIDAENIIDWSSYWSAKLLICNAKSFVCVNDGESMRVILEKAQKIISQINMGEIGTLEYQKVVVEHRYFMAISLMSLKNWPDSMKSFLEALKLFRSLKIKRRQYDCLKHIAGIFSINGEFQRAEKIFLRCLNRYRKSVYVQGIVAVSKNLGLLYMIRRLDGKALEMFSEALDVSRDIGYKVSTSICLNHMGIIELYSGNSEKAWNCLKEAEKVTANADNWLQRYWNMLYMGEYYDCKGLPDEAHRCINDAVKLSKKHNRTLCETKALCDLGKHYFRNGKYDLCRECLSEVQNLFKPEESKRTLGLMHYYRGQLSLNENDLEKAVDEFKKSLWLNRDYGCMDVAFLSLWRLADIYERTGEKALMKEALVDALKTNVMLIPDESPETYISMEMVENKLTSF